MKTLKYWECFDESRIVLINNSVLIDREIRVASNLRFTGLTCLATINEERAASTVINLFSRF